jgi:hypothetical protein
LALRARCHLIFVPPGEVIHYGKSIDITEWKQIIVVWRDDIWLLLLPEWSNISCALFLLVPFACAPQHQAPAPRISSRQKRWSENDDKMRARFCERIFKLYSQQRVYFVLVIMRARCQLAERQKQNKREKDDPTWHMAFLLQLYSLRQYSNLPVHVAREKNFAQAECIINLKRNFIAFL